MPESNQEKKSGDISHLKKQEDKLVNKVFSLSNFIIPILVALGAMLAYYLFTENIALGFTFCVSVILTVFLVAKFPKDKYQRLVWVGGYLLVIAASFYWYYTTLTPKVFFEVPGKELPPQIKENFQIWALQAGLLRLAHVLLGLVATTTSILAASNIEKLKSQNVKSTLSITAAICFSVLSAFDLGDKANKERTAWRNMNTAIIRYQQGIDTSKAKLIEAYEDAEKTIGDVKPSPKEGNAK